MGLSVFQRLAGTLSDRFRISRSGPTIHQGTDHPDTSGVEGGDGDVYIRHGSNPGLFQMSAGVWREMSTMSVQRQPVSSSEFNATELHHYLGVNRNGTVEIFLPAGVTEKTFIIKDEGGFCNEVNAVTIHPYPGETIDGSNSYVMESPRSSITIVYGAEWHVI